MQNHTHDALNSLPPLMPYGQGDAPMIGYSTLAHNALIGIGSLTTFYTMLDTECRVAIRLLRWIDAHPRQEDYRAAIKSVPYGDEYDADKTLRLRLALWRQCDASQWIAPQDATSSRDQLWEFAIVRLSCYLHTGAYLLGGGQ